MYVVALVGSVHTRLNFAPELSNAPWKTILSWSSACLALSTPKVETVEADIIFYKIFVLKFIFILLIIIFHDIFIFNLNHKYIF